MPENRRVLPLPPAGVQFGSRLASRIASVHQATPAFTTPADLEALARLSQNDLQSLLGRTLIETTPGQPATATCISRASPPTVTPCSPNWRT